MHCDRCGKDSEVHKTERGNLCISCLTELAMCYLEEDDISYVKTPKDKKAIKRRSKASGRAVQITMVLDK
jgi:hypothetical protein